MAVPIVKIRGVSKSFGKKLVLNDVNIEVNEGEIFGIIGASGAGKTTLLEAIIGFIPLNKGEISFRKESAVQDFMTLKKNPALKKEIGFSTQYPSFYDKLTVKENLKYFAMLYDVPEKFVEQRVKKIIDLVELNGEEDTFGGELSGGMQKRLDIACSLINDPKIIIFDEPTADLDPLLRKHIWHLIEKIHSLGKTVIISSHFLDEMDLLCDRIALIYDKTVIHTGTAEELRKKYPYSKEIVVNIASQNYKDIIEKLRIKALPISKIIKRGNKMVIYTQEPEPVLRDLLTVLEKQNEEILELDLQRPTLDEVFTAIVKENK